MKVLKYITLIIFSLFATNVLASNKLRIATYNIHYGKGENDYRQSNWSQEDMESIIDSISSVITSLKPDIIALQELDSGMISRNKRFLIAEIAKRTKGRYRFVYVPTHTLDGGNIGCGALISCKFKEYKVFSVPLPGDEPRTLIKIHFPKFIFAITHGDLNNAKRKCAFQTILRELGKTNKPTFLAGDLNDCCTWKNDGSSFNILLKEFTVISDTHCNTVWNGKHALPNDRQGIIDYILLNKRNNSVSVIDSHIVTKIADKNILLKKVSDHYPVYVDVCVKAAY